MDSKSAPNMPEYLPPSFQASARFGNGTNRSSSTVVTAVLTAAVLASGMVAAAIIFRGSGYSVITCPTAVDHQADQSIALPQNKIKRSVLVTEGGDHLTEVFDYDRQSNILLIDAPANISDGNSAATIAIDVDRSVMFINIHDSNTCIGLVIENDFAHIVQDYFEEENNKEIDISHVGLVIENYRLAGKIPASYIKATNGPVIRGLCSGRETFWAKTVTEGELERHRRRTCSSTTVCVCLKRCLCVTVERCRP